MLLAALGLPLSQAEEVVAEPPVPAPLAGAMLYEPRPFALGPVAVTPRLGHSQAYNTNVNLTQESPIVSRVSTWSPAVGFSLSGEDSRYDLNLRGEVVRFHASPANDAHNAEATLDAVQVTGERSALAWRASWQDWHEEVGNSALGELNPTPNRFNGRAIGGVWRADSEGGEHRFELEATLSRKAYVNHRETTRIGDVTTRGAVLRYLWASQPGTRWLGEWRKVSARYGLREADLDNFDTRWLLGLQWEASEQAPAELTGLMKVGLQTKHFYRGRPRYWGTTWDASLQWRPRASTVWELGSARAAADAPGDQSNEVLERRDALAWTEAWRQDFRTTLSVSGGRQRHFYPGGFWRQDRVRGYDLGFRHDLARQWQWGWTHSLVHRRSSIDGLNFTRRLDLLVVECAW